MTGRRLLKKKPAAEIKRLDNYFAVHAHSEYSHLDGIGTVPMMVAKSAKMGHPAMALTDHGSMAGTIRLYKECKKHGIVPFPGSEMYLVESVDDKELREKRYHIGMLALNLRGYKALVRLSSFSYRRDRFHRKPLIDWSDLEALSEHAKNDIAITTGCFFGWIIQNHIAMGRDLDRTAMLLKKLVQMFPHTYVELQHHNIGDHDDGVNEEDIIGDLVQLARGMGLPMVAGQDSHYLEVRDQSAHDMMKRIGYYGDAEDSIFPGGPYHHASSAFVLSNFPKDVRADLQDGHLDLLNRNTLKIPVFDDYKFHVPTISSFPDEQLKRKCQRGLERLHLDAFSPYETRLKHELKVISTMDMSNYFLLVEDILLWCKKNDIITNTRGSANGSLVCYLLGISEVDPIKWDTDFERFLDLERRKPPDIDIDVESSQRHLIIDYMKSKFPSTLQMGTYSKLGITEDVDPLTGEVVDRGSIWVQYHSAMKRRDPRHSDDIPVPLQHRKDLKRLSVLRARKAPGAHAAGFVLPADDLPIEDYLPSMLIASSGTTVTQSPMDDVEDAGYLKLDILGVSTLGVINRCISMIGKPVDDLTWIPWDDPMTCRLLSSGRTEGTFQFDGYSTSMGGKEMKIKSTNDVILCMALYRPALMESGQKDKFLELRKKNEVETIDPLFDRFMEGTFGVPVFQEQVMRMMRAAGLTILQWNDVMKAVKASNDKIEQALVVFRRTKPIFIRGAIKNGATKEGAERAWETVMEFTDYGFNKAHATSYGIMAYRSAYLRAHYPHEFFTALLQVWAGTTKETRFRRAARHAKFKLAKPNVNTSGVLWTMDPERPNTIVQGLLSIKGVGEKAADAIIRERDENGLYKSVDDLIARVPARPVTGGKDYSKTGELKGVLLKLQQSSALSSIEF